MLENAESSLPPSDDLLRIGLFWPAHRTQMPAPSVARANPNVVDIEFQKRVARDVEAAGFDFVLMPDGYSGSSGLGHRLGYGDPAIYPPLWALPLLDVTTTLGVVTTMHPLYLEPSDIAAYGAVLDRVSGGRWGWNITPGYRDEEARLFGHEAVAEHGVRYDITEDSVEIAIRLWSGEEVSYSGKELSAQGRLPGPLPVQKPYPLLVNAGSSGRGKDFAGRLCHYVFTTSPVFSYNPPLAREFAEIAEGAGRAAPARLLMLCPSLLRDDPEVARAELQAVKVDQMAVMSGVNATAVANSGSDNARVWREAAQRINETDLVGTPEEVAAKIVGAYREHGLRGILITMPSWWPEDLERYARVFGALREAGVWRPASERSSLW